MLPSPPISTLFPYTTLFRSGIEQTKEIAREQRVWRWADEFLQDLRFGMRMLFRSPGFSILAILCLTLGIGTNAAALSRSEEHTSELQSRRDLVCRLLLEKKK